MMISAGLTEVLRQLSDFTPLLSIKLLTEVFMSQDYRVKSSLIRIQSSFTTS